MDSKRVKTDRTVEYRIQTDTSKVRAVRSGFISSRVARVSIRRVQTVPAPPPGGLMAECDCTGDVIQIRSDGLVSYRQALEMDLETATKLHEVLGYLLFLPTDVPNSAGPEGLPMVKGMEMTIHD